MKIYLAARYSRREELCGYRERLEQLGHTVTSRWLKGNHQISNEGIPLNELGLPFRGPDDQAAEMRARFAAEDLADVRTADMLVAFTEEPRSIKTRGGRHVEFGYALALGILVVIVGPEETVFHWGQNQFASFDAFMLNLDNLFSAHAEQIFGQKCEKCGRVYSLVWSAQSAQWNRITASESMACPSCYDTLLQSAGETCLWVPIPIEVATSALFQHWINYGAANGKWGGYPPETIEP
jgi:nucleoside 2-deoxyribosyltransferase